MPETLGNTYEDKPQKPKKSGTDTGNKENSGTGPGDNKDNMPQGGAIDTPLDSQHLLLQKEAQLKVQKIEAVIKEQDQNDAENLLKQLEGGYTSGTSTGSNENSSTGNDYSNTWQGNSIGDIPSGNISTGSKIDITIGVTTGKQKQEKYNSGTDVEEQNGSKTQLSDNMRSGGGSPDIPDAPKK